MQASSKSRSKGEIVNGKRQGVLQECKRHEQDARSSSGSVPRSSNYWWMVRQVWRRIMCGMVSGGANQCDTVRYRVESTWEVYRNLVGHSEGVLRGLHHVL